MHFERPLGIAWLLADKHIDLTKCCFNQSESSLNSIGVETEWAISRLLASFMGQFTNEPLSGFSRRVRKRDLPVCDVVSLVLPCFSFSRLLVARQPELIQSISIPLKLIQFNSISMVACQHLFHNYSGQWTNKVKWMLASAKQIVVDWRHYQFTRRFSFTCPVSLSLSFYLSSLPVALFPPLDRPATTKGSFRPVNPLLLFLSLFFFVFIFVSSSKLLLVCCRRASCNLSASVNLQLWCHERTRFTLLLLINSVLAREKNLEL